MNTLMIDSAGTAIVRDADDRFHFRLPGPHHRWHRLSPPPATATAAPAAPAAPPPGKPRRRLTWRRVRAVARLLGARIRRAVTRRPEPQAG